MKDENMSLLHQALRSAVEKHNTEAWDQLQQYIDKHNQSEKSSIESESEREFVLIETLIKLACQILDDVEWDRLMEDFGYRFIEECHNDIKYQRVLHSIGYTLSDFLIHFDCLHDHLNCSKKFTNILPPSFICNVENPDSILLESYHQRNRWSYFTVGIVKAVAEIVFNQPVSIDVLEASNRHENYKCQFYRIHYRCISLKKSTQAINVSTSPKDLKILPATFCKAFPFHFIINRDMVLIQVGSGLIRFLPSELPDIDIFLGSSISYETRYFADCLKMVTPKVEPTFEDILSYCNSRFTLETVSQLHGKTIQLRGQMIYASESDCILYVGSPCVSALEELKGRGLYLSDIPVHDATRDVILVGEQAKVQEDLVTRMQKVKAKLEQASKELRQEKTKNVDLLNTIFPKDIAMKLWKRKYPLEQLCRRVDNVTVLFSDIVGFTAICSTCEPFVVVEMLNRLYTKFDDLSAKLNVYKVETIGDAYVVAGGLEQKSNRHAHDVCYMSIGMILVSQTEKSHDGKLIKMRIGIHTGSVVAGIVGYKMPRYCLFGNNVRLANKMEACSQAGRINVSPTTYKLVHNSNEFTFEKRTPDCLPKDFPTQPGDTCYYLNVTNQMNMLEDRKS
uniref:guanylate cyclase n=1 Tax=Placozoa sp. H4 TaxID=1034858 RepID=A0A7G7LKC8_9METZ|nr:soluble GCY-like 6 [Placozoa sp. H4]